MVTPRQFIAGIGVALGIVAAVFLMLPVHADGTDSLFGNAVTVDCGSAVATSTGAPSTACDAEIGTRRAWTIPLLAVGVLAVIGSLFVSWPARREQATPTEPDPA